MEQWRRWKKETPSSKSIIPSLRWKHAAFAEISRSQLQALPSGKQGTLFFRSCEKRKGRGPCSTVIYSQLHSEQLADGRHGIVPTRVPAETLETFSQRLKEPLAESVDFGRLVRRFALLLSPVMEYLAIRPFLQLSFV